MTRSVSSLPTGVGKAKSDAEKLTASPKTISEGRSNAGNTHIAGEMFVAAELAKRGYSVSLTMGNAKAVDLFAEYKGKSICIQVKAIAHKKNVGWPLPFRKEKIIDHVLYVCVVLNKVNEAPTYYVLPPDEVRQRGKWYATRAILDLGTVRNSEFLGAWHLIDKALRDPNQVIETNHQPMTAIERSARAWSQGRAVRTRFTWASG